MSHPAGDRPDPPIARAPAPWSTWPAGLWRKSEPKGARPHLLSPAGSGGLVLTPGVCHVPHRTALLSQLVASSARGRGDPGKDARGPAAEGEGASDGGMKAAKAGSGTKVASRMQ